MLVVLFDRSYFWGGGDGGGGGGGFFFFFFQAEDGIRDFCLSRGLDVLMIFNTLGVRGIGEFIHRSVQTWSLTLVFLSSLVLVFIEIWCAFSLVKGRRWARWLYLLTQITAASYLWAASLGYGYPELFSIPGESKREIFHSLMLQKLPDMLILMLLFVPSTSRRFFQLQ